MTENFAARRCPADSPRHDRRAKGKLYLHGWLSDGRRKSMQALGEARKAVETIRAAESTSDNSKARRDRDQCERWAFLVEDVFFLLSRAAHDDPGTTEHFV
ncbi:hypothetical protein ACQPZF_10430 [Actinosynnema sp. CS-041913]|uniref:hypothetical protein n=1 Tax=Actinosynnema sp. CS-041913 TaxID=3239917 RepID=UPI003D950AD6